ncbi:MAG TPA: hypothetical protein VL461_14035 [Dictyobacter sp.]|nr:hypothetical protein [Dictyobacter sp.]
MTQSLPVTSWHKASYDRFIQESLPALLDTCMPLIDYQVYATTTYTCDISLSLSDGANDVSVVYHDIPRPDDEGLFIIDGKKFAVVPYASSDDLEHADIFCVGEQLLQLCQQHLHYQAPITFPWNEELVRTVLPLETWIQQFFENSKDKHALPGIDFMLSTAQRLDETNWLATKQHLTRIYIKDRTRLFTPGHFGRLCPFETPEGPNIGRIGPLTRGASIRDGKIVVLDERPEAMLGAVAATIPLLEHDNPTGLLMGANMLRQWLKPSQPEPALVQTGNEPAVADFWCGRNLLTAFVSWGIDTFASGIVISESCARKLNYPEPIAPGDKLSNRHGMKGVVSQIIPDELMPYLPDGTPVELVCNAIHMHTQRFFGSIRETVLGRIAHAEGMPFMAPPFHAPDEQEIRRRLAQSGLPEDGMEQLHQGRDGQPLTQRCSVGWIYWGRLNHLAADKLRPSLSLQYTQTASDLEYYALRDAQAYQVISDMFTHAATHRVAADLLCGSAQAVTLAPQFVDVMTRLSLVSIQAVLEPHGEHLEFHFAPFAGEKLTFARAVPHPWLTAVELNHIGISSFVTEMPEYQMVFRTNKRLQRMLDSGAPESLTRQAYAQLINRVNAFCAALLTPAQLHFQARHAYSAHAVIVPGLELDWEQVGLPEQLAWKLFTPRLLQEISSEAIEARTVEAIQALEALMARSWVVVQRAPVLSPRSCIACHPVRIAGDALRLHPFINGLLQADFDGDQIAVFLPVTDEGQQDAGSKLSMRQQIMRDPLLLDALVPVDEVMWGLADLSLTDAGRAQLAALTGNFSFQHIDMLTRTLLSETLHNVYEVQGVDHVLKLLDELYRMGFISAQRAGISINPLLDQDSMAYFPRPALADEQSWQLYLEEVGEKLAARTDYHQYHAGTLLLAIKSGACGELRHLLWFLFGQGIMHDVSDQPVAIAHGYYEGHTAVEMFTLAVHARAYFAHVLREWELARQEVQARNSTQGFHVLERAMRAEHPGLVFANAASIGEIDPLVDKDSRLFIGLPPFQS